jgi:hypothetical protein
VGWQSFFGFYVTYLSYYEPLYNLHSSAEQDGSKKAARRLWDFDIGVVLKVKSALLYVAKCIDVNVGPLFVAKLC